MSITVTTTQLTLAMTILMSGLRHGPALLERRRQKLHGPRVIVTVVLIVIVVVIVIVVAIVIVVVIVIVIVAVIVIVVVIAG